MKPETLYKMLDEMQPRTIRPYKVVNDTIYLRCSKCLEWKLVEQYAARWDMQKFFRRRPECMTCQVDKHRQYLAKNPSKAREFIERRKAVLKETNT